MQATERAESAKARRGWSILGGFVVLWFASGQPIPAQSGDRIVTAGELRAAVVKYQHSPRGPELPVDVLTIDPDAGPEREVSADQAREDVERFFHLLEHGYCGYGYFLELGSFEAACESLLEELGERGSWSTDDLARRIRQHLDFVHDCHMKLGDVRFAGHQDFWFAPEPELVERDGRTLARTEHGDCAVVSVESGDPAGFVFRSLDAAGLVVHRFGTLSLDEPDPLRVVLEIAGREVERSVPLECSEHKPSALFDSFRLGGLPVVRIRTFSDHHEEELQAFLATADELRGEPCVLLDLRGNGGGSTRWPREWIRRFTGATPELNQVLTELITRTSLVGQANYMAWLAAGPGRAIRDRLEVERAGLLERVRAFDAGGSQPYWSAVYFPRREPIRNDTTLVVVADRAVASSGEGLISYLRGQVENVVLVGENTRGALVFGHTTAHRLPHSGLLAILPVKLNVPLDLQWREERGFEPDYWVSAAEALNRAVAAVRAGTIATRIPLPPAILEAEFVPESQPWFTAAERRRLGQVVWVVAVTVLFFAVNRRRSAWLSLLLAVALFTAAAVGLEGNRGARVLAIGLGGASLVIAAGWAWRARRRSARSTSSTRQ